MKGKWLGLSEHTQGVLAGIASGVLVAAYLITNKYIYNTYHIGALEYALIFSIFGGLYGGFSLARNLNATSYKKVRQDIHKFLVLSLAGFLAIVLLVIGQRYTTSVNTAIIGTGSIITTMFFSALMLGERITKRQAIWLAIMFIGLYVGIVGVHTMHLNKGDLIIISCEFAFGFGNVFGRRLMHTHGSLLVPNIRHVLVALYALVVSIFVVRNFAVIGQLWPWALLSALFLWLCMKTFAASVHLINANHAIVLNNSQVVITALAGVLLLGEHYTWEKLIGSVIVLTSIYFITIKGRKA